MRPAHPPDVLTTSCATHQWKAVRSIERHGVGFVLAMRAGEEGHLVILDVRAAKFEMNEISHLYLLPPPNIALIRAIAP
jgi:hypothetical protein